MSAYREPRRRSPPLPVPRGPLSSEVVTALRTGPDHPIADLDTTAADPFGDDLQLALYVLYELHYQGFADVDEECEWDPALLGLRRSLERPFLEALRAGARTEGDVDTVLAGLLVEPVGDDGNSVSHFLRKDGELWQLREYAALRSLYHLKEADPHAWVIPRLYGRAKAAMVAVEFDEFGGGREADVHARLYADLMTDLSLETAYGHYLDVAPADVLATVNLMSLFGLHRSLRGALVGHFAAVEVTSSPGSRRLAAALKRVGAGEAAQRFYDEHVEADAVHEQVVRRDVIGGLLADEPHLASDVAFGIEATGLVEDRLAARLLAAWRSDSTALRAPLD
ncbi:iron-containing redox enzyme family protein [Streptomyces sp. cmx-18-6]|uniref:iron-containing redox enzyme family protein n=1 Tax=Streptomyces sp. cmx-18-6 TaxID=2790930 RepID=UPI00397F46A7